MTTGTRKTPAKKPTRKSGSKKKKQRWTRWIVIGALVAFVGFFIYYTWIYNRTHFIRYPEFGISLPAKYMIHGIDVSHHQARIDWQEVALMKSDDVKIGFAFIKATEGLRNKDRQFDRNWRLAKREGIPRGAYHFFLATKSGREQAHNFIKHVRLSPGDLPPVLDVEDTYGVDAPTVRVRVKEWLQTVEAYYDVTPILYTSADFYTRILGKEFENYPLWVAHYLQPVQPRIQRRWIFWQHSETGHVNGIRGKVDFNVFSGDSLEFRKLLLP